MGRQSDNPTIVSSSIALLQERFRKLERVRERREERELLNLFSDPPQVAPPMLSIQLDTGFITSRPILQDHSLSLRLDSQGFEPPKTPSSTRKLEVSDVDTSLHL